MIDLDHRRNKTREALRQIKVGKAEEKGLQYDFPDGISCHNTHNVVAQSWMCLGNTFLKVDSSLCKKMLNKGEFSPI